MKKIRIVSIVTLFLVSISGLAQTPTWNMANAISSNGDEDQVTDVAVDPSTGDIYVVGFWDDGNLSGTLGAGAGSQDFSGTYGREDGFVAKYDDTFGLLWAFKIGGTRDDRINSISIDPAGNIYITGYFSDGNAATAEFQGTNATTGSLTNTDSFSDFFVAKYNSSGHLQWVKQGASAGGASNNDVYGAEVVAHANGAFVVGAYNDPTSFGPITLDDLGWWFQPFVMSYATDGTEVWGVSGEADNPGYGYFNSVVTDGTDVFISGNFESGDLELFDDTYPGPSTLGSFVTNTQSGNKDIVLISLTANTGAVNWMQLIGSTNDDVDYDMVLDADSIYLTGGIDNNTSFPGYAGNPVSSSGGRDVFISSHAKSDGNTGWVQTATSTDNGDQEGVSITMFGTSTILVTGYFEDDLTFSGTTITSNTADEEDGFVAAYTSDGIFYWTKAFGGDNDDSGLGIATNSTDQVYVGGYHDKATDFDAITLPDNGGNLEGFIAAIEPCTDAVSGVAATADANLCAGESTTITLAGYDGLIQWQSSPAGLDTWSDIVGENSASVIGTPASSTDYRAVVSSLSCNPDTTNTIAVVVKPLPIASTTGTTTICSGANTQIDIDFTGTAPYDFTYTDGTTPTSIVGHGTNNYNTNVSPATNTYYTVTSVSDATGCSNTGPDTAFVIVNPNVSIVTQPASQSACPGSNVSFTIIANGLGLGYQWKKDGVDMPGETNAVLAINNVTAAADYTCEVTSTCGGPLLSDIATLSLNTETSISVHPLDDHLCDSESLSLSVTAIGSNLTFQWRKDGVDLVDGGNISGATADNLVITNATAVNQGNYTCYVQGACGDEESNPAVVQVDAPIVITGQPSNLAACPSDNISFTVVATGTNLTYQWQKAGINLSGEISQSLIMNNIVDTCAGLYRCIVASVCGDTTYSSTAILNVNIPTAISAHPVDFEECLGGNANFEVTATGTNLTYQWIKDGAPLTDTGSFSGSQTDQLIITGLGIGYNGTYSCEVTGDCGVLNSNPADLLVNDAIAITTQPLSQGTCPGNNISLNVVATGTNLTYQWQMDGVDIPGETNSILNLNSIVDTSAADYQCIITNSCGQSLDSDIATLTVSETTLITLEPVDAIECIGNNVNFTVAATGSNLNYRWYDGAVPLNDIVGKISGSSTNNLVISNLDLADAGTYYCKVTGDCGTEDSNPADLTIDDNIVITADPADMQACIGDNVSFEVIATGSNLTYQWQKNLADIAGETNSVLNLNNIDGTYAGSYRCVISNSCGTTLNSQEATLSLYTNTSIPVAGQPADVTGCISSNASFVVTALGDNLQYKWKKNGVDLTDAGNISGSSTNTLNLTGLILGDDGVYSCLVSGSCDTVLSDPATLTLNELTTISAHPSNQVACPGENAVYTVTANGTNLNYQWQRNGVNIGGATNSSYIINNVDASHVGIYRCIVTGDCGSSTSIAALLTVRENVNISVHPTNDTVCEGQVTGFSVTATGTGLSYQWFGNGIDLNDGGVYSGTETPNLTIDPSSTIEAGNYVCVVSGTCGSETSNTSSLVVYEEIVISTQPQNKVGCDGDNISFNVTATGTSLTYQWQKDGTDIPGENNSALLLNNVTSDDEAVYRCELTGECGVTYTNGASLTLNDDIIINTHPVDDEICEGDVVGFTIDATGTGIAYQWKFNGDSLFDGGAISGATTNNLVIDPGVLTDAGVYTCEVAGTCNTVNSTSVTLTVNELNNITTHPQNRTNCTGEDVTFNVNASGTNLTYKWQKDGSFIPGEMNSGLLLSNIVSGDAGIYNCVVYGACDSVISNGATLIVNEDVSITSQPVDKEVCEGEITNFSVLAAGSDITYQWKLNGVDISDDSRITGSNSNTLSIDSVVLADDGIYTCEITGICNTVNSTSVNLTVNENINISSHPQNKTGCPGEDITLNVVATGANLSYKWQKDDSFIAGETNSGLLLTNVVAVDAGIYRCIVYSDCDSVISNGATLVVNADASITLHPIDDEVCEGESANFSIAATGTGLSYQWKRNGIDLTDNTIISGSETNSLSIDSASTSDAGVYTCEIIGTCGPINSDPANLTVNEHVVITGHPVNVTACPTENVTFSVSATGNIISYQWQRNGGVLAGETNPGITLPGVTDANEGTYRCVITGDCGTSISNGATLVVDKSVAITTQPSANPILCEGDNLNLNIVATGTGLTYQWQKDGIDLKDTLNISGTNSDNLVINNVDENNDGIYTCIVAGSCGSVTSDLSDVIVYPTTAITQHPVVYNVVEGGNATFSIVAEGNITTYQWQRDGVDLSDGAVISGSATSLLTLTGVAEANEGAYRCVVTGTCNVSNSNPANLIVNPTSNITTQPNDAERCENESVGFSVVASGGGLIYQWKLNGSDLNDNTNISGSQSANLTIDSVSLSDAGAYTCVVNGESSSPAVLTVNENTTINTHPTAQIRCEGDNVIFSVTAFGSGLTYNWFRDAIDLSDGGTISGSSTSTLTISSVVEANEGIYRCEVSGTCGSINSNPVPLIIFENTLITTQPVGNTICEDESHTFTVISDGDSLTYAWKKDGVLLSDSGNVSGAKTSNLVISNADITDQGSYTCSVTGECGFENSVIAQLFVEPATNITLQPIDATACEGENINLSVLAEGVNLTYQWQKDGIPLFDVGSITGSSTANIAITGVVGTDAGSYVCVVTGNCGIQNSDPALLTANDSTKITSQPTGSDLCEGETVTLSVVASGGNLSYQWKKNGVDLKDTLNITGSVTANLNIANANLFDAGSYSCEVTGDCFTENSSLAQINVRPTTDITTQPIDQIGCEGDNITFSVIAAGHSLTYKWQKDGSDLSDVGIISGSSTALLSLSGITAADAGSYRCVVEGTCGIVNSDPAQLTANDSTRITIQPVGSDLCEGESLTLSVVATGGNLAYQWKKDGVELSDSANITGSNTANLNIANISLANQGTYSCLISGDCYSENSDLALINVWTTSTITSQPIDKTGCDGDNITFSVVAEGQALTYKWQKDGSDLSDVGNIAGSSTALLSITGITAADAGSYRCIVSGSCGTINSDPAALTAYQNTVITTQPVGDTICENSSITMNVMAAGDNLSYQWKKGATPLVDTGSVSGSTTSVLSINNANLTDAGTYSCEVTGSCGTENSGLATLVVEKPTQVMVHPTDISSCAGDNISFSVLATGTNLSYQWQKDGGNLTDAGNISGSLTNLLQVSSITLTDAGSYRCIVIGDCGMENSNPAILTANDTTSISIQPTGSTVCEGNQVTLSLTATGESLTYQWKKDGIALADSADISGATTSNLIINNSTLSDAGVYTCDVSGSCGSENSSAVNVIIKSSTSISSQPQNLTKCEGDVAVFSVTASGESIAYQWQKDGASLADGANIFGSSSNTLTLSNLTTIETGAYRCVIIGTCGIMNSDAANLTVNAYPSAAGGIIGPASVCQNDSNVIYEVAAITNVDYYVWNLPVGVSILSGDSTRLIEVTFSDNELGGNITVQGENSCGLGIPSAPLTVTANPIPSALAGPDQSLCIDNTTLQAIDPGTATGTWSVVDGPANVQFQNQYDSPISNLREGTNTLVWTVSENGCSANDTVIISNNHVNVEAGTDVTICTESITLEGNGVPSGAVGSWSVTTGTANFVNGNNPSTTANGFSTGINVLRWTITKGSCSSYDTVVVDNQMPTQSFAGIDQSICRDSTSLNAINPIVGAGAWSVIAGSATFSDPTQYNSDITSIGQGTNILRWTINNGICSSIDEVTIGNNQLNVIAGVDQVICDRTTNLGGETPVSGIGTWSVVTGSAAFVNSNLSTTTVTGLDKGDNLLAWNINNNGCISRDTVLITNDSPTESDAGADQVLAADFTTLQGNIPTIGTGTWTLISGSANIANPSLYNTNVTSLALGDNTFRWTISHNSCISESDVIITNFMSTTTDAGDDQTICSDETTLDGNEPTFGFGEWSVIQGSAIFEVNGQYNTKVSGLAKGDNVLRWSIWENGWTSDDVVITNDSPTASNAGSDVILCGDTIVLAGNEPIVGSGIWSVMSGSGQFLDDTLYNTEINNLAKGENILKWTITNKSCSSSDLVTITNGLPTTAIAGNDQVLCENITTLNPNTPSVGVGSWSVVSGAGDFSENTVSNLATGDNTLRWTIATDYCASYDDVLITNNEPSDAQAGADVTLCLDSHTLNASTPIIGTGVWSLQNGSATIGDPNAASTSVTNMDQGLNVFRWTVTHNGCTKFEEVTIHNALIQATVGPNQDICDESTVLEGNNPEVGTGTWSVLGGSGAAVFMDPNQPDTRVNGLDKGANTLRWTIENDICISSADVVITNNLPSEAFAGPDDDICADNTRLQANTPVIGVGVWSILSGSATISNLNSPTSTISGLEYGVNTLRWTITNNGCTSSDEVVISNNSTVPSDAGTDQTVCADSTYLYGNNPPFGAGQWSVVSGSATFEDNSKYNTKVTELGPGQNQLKWVISNGGCSSSDEMIITNNQPTLAVAGADQTICGDSTTLLGNTPYIGTGSWSLISGAATFTDNTYYNTNVTGLNPGENTLRWTIEYMGCTSTDDVVITNDLPYVADAGGDMTICSDQAGLFANDPIIGTGQWIVISGSATFDDPSKYNANIDGIGFGVNTLRWTITYDQCTTFDEIKVTNNQIDVYAGEDQVIGTPTTFLAANNPSTGLGTWSVIGGFGEFTESNNSISSVSSLGAGLNTFRWSVDIDGCISHDDVSVTFNVPPVPSFVINKNAGCPPLDVYFVNNSLSSLPFKWEFGDGDTSVDVTVQHTYDEPGLYTASLTVVGNAGELVTIDTLITVYNQPEASFLVVNKEVYIPDEEAIFINTSIDDESYLWEFGDGNTSTEREPRHNYVTEGLFDVTLHVWSEYQCYDTVTYEEAVLVEEKGVFKFPSAFTPNKDGSSGGHYNQNDFSNDVFYPVGEGIGEYHIEVFNKWGVLVFESKDINVGWDGYYNDRLLEEGVYVWKVTGKYNNGKDFMKVGTVLLLH